MRKKVFLALSLALASAAHAISPERIDSTINLQGVVVSANKIGVNKNSVPLSVSTIEQKEIEASSESALLPVLSQRIPGLFVTQKGITGFGVSEGSAGTINIRGVGQGNKVLILFDGQPQWAGVFGHSLPDTYVASDVERVEVIRGPGSLLYGSNAMGGVVNIITRDQKEAGRQTRARLMYGSFNTQKYMFSNGYSVGKLSSFVSLNHDRTDGHRPDSKFHITNGFGKLGYALSAHYKATADLSVASYKNNNPGKIDDPLLHNTMEIVRGTTSFALENNYDKTSGAVRGFYNWGDHEINDGYRPNAAPRMYLFHSTDHNAGVLLYQSFRLLEGNNFTVGLDYKNWGGKAWNDSINGNRQEIVDKNIHEIAGYAIAQHDLFEIMSLNAGIRFEHNKAFGGAWVPQAGVAFRFIEGNILRASLSKGFRSPNIREMYMFPPQNPDLKPESMMNYEAAVGQSLLEGNLYFEATFFYIDGKDMIEVVRVAGKPQNQNTGAFRNKGFELETKYHITNQLTTAINYSFLHTSKALLAAPKHTFVANASYAPGRFSVDLNLMSISGLYINTADGLKENYTTLHAKAAYRFGTHAKGFNLFVKGENLTAAKYQINEGFPMPKTIVMGGIDIRF